MSSSPKTFVPPLKVFVSYAHEDEPHREALARHLQPLVDEGLITLWHDRRITGGRDWARDIDAALRSADVVLLLISRDFVASDYCRGVELAEAMKLDDAGLARVVPVILRSCDWQHANFARFNALPPDGEPVVEAPHPDQRFSAVAKGLRAIVAELTAAPAAGPSPVAAAPAVAPVRRTLKIAQRALLLLLAAAGLAGYWALLRAPMADARDAMRKARYDLALQALERVPPWLRAWPGLDAPRSAASLGARTFQPRPDWEAIGGELRSLRARRPKDVDLMVLDATNRLRDNDFEAAAALAASAAEHDPANAEAWFVRGTVLDLVQADLSAALDAYRRATDAAPDSPQYRNNLARTLLELGRHDEAIDQFRQIKQFPLARVEEALAHWARGEPRVAADNQREALAMLADAELAARFHNRREWTFVLRSLGRGHGLGQDNKRCYAEVGEAASLRLSGESAAFPPAACAKPPQMVRELVADDLCRFVDRSQAEMSATARELRQALGMPAACPVPDPAPAEAKT